MYIDYPSITLVSISFLNVYCLLSCFYFQAFLQSSFQKYEMITTTIFVLILHTREQKQREVKDLNTVKQLIKLRSNISLDYASYLYFSSKFINYVLYCQIKINTVELVNSFGCDHNNYGYVNALLEASMYEFISLTDI